MTSQKMETIFLSFLSPGKQQRMDMGMVLTIWLLDIYRVMIQMLRNSKYQFY